jgi:hypothetical protein
MSTKSVARRRRIAGASRTVGGVTAGRADLPSIMAQKRSKRSAVARSPRDAIKPRFTTHLSDRRGRERRPIAHAGGRMRRPYPRSGTVHDRLGNPSLPRNPVAGWTSPCERREMMLSVISRASSMVAGAGLERRRPGPRSNSQLPPRSLDSSGDVCPGDAPAPTSAIDRGVRPDAHSAARAALPPILGRPAAPSGVSVRRLTPYSDHKPTSCRSRQFNPSRAFLEA